MKRKLLTFLAVAAFLAWGVATPAVGGGMVPLSGEELDQIQAGTVVTSAVPSPADHPLQAGVILWDESPKQNWAPVNNVSASGSQVGLGSNVSAGSGTASIQNNTQMNVTTR